MNHSQSALGTEKIEVLMRAYALPCILSLLIGALYNIVDQIFIANATYLGSYGNAANTVVFPLTVVALALSVMIGDGCCAFLSIAFGSKQPRSAAVSVGNSIVVNTVLSLLLLATYLCLGDSILKMFGGAVNVRTFTFAKEYFSIITWGIPLYMFGQMMNPIIRADGSPRFAMMAAISGALINLVLDPIFIFAFHLGMAGAAMATILGQAVTCLLSFGYALRFQTIQLVAASFRLQKKIIFRTLELGMTSFLAQISIVASIAVINRMAGKYSALDPVFSNPAYAQIPIAVIGIVMKFFQIVISIVIGMAAGCIPIVGYNMGANAYDRVRQLLHKILFAEAVVGIAAFCVAELFPRPLSRLFGSANESVYYTTFALRAFRIYFSMIVIACLNKAVFIFLQAMGKAWQSTILSILRELVFGIGFALLLPCFFGLTGLLFSMPLADAVTGCFVAVAVWRINRQLSSD